MLASTVREAATRFEHQPAFVADGGWPLSYRDLDRLSDEAAVGLTARGITSGDVVALALPSTPDYVVAYAALAKLGAITTGVNPRSTPAERAVVIEVSDAAVLIAVDEAAAPVVAQAAASDHAVLILRPA